MNACNELEPTEAFVNDPALATEQRTTVERGDSVTVAAALVEAEKTSGAAKSKEIEVSVERLGDPEHRRQHFRIPSDEPLLAVLDEGARLLGEVLLPSPDRTLDRLRGVYRDDKIGEPLDLEETLGEFLDRHPVTHHFAVELVLAIRVNTQWRVAPETEMSPKAILGLFGLSWEQYTLYKPDETEPLPLDTPLHLERGECFEAQKDGKYGGEGCAER